MKEKMAALLLGPGQMWHHHQLWHHFYQREEDLHGMAGAEKHCLPKASRQRTGGVDDDDDDDVDSQQETKAECKSFKKQQRENELHEEKEYIDVCSKLMAEID
jgi:hypothetical protein